MHILSRYSLPGVLLPDHIPLGTRAPVAVKTTGALGKSQSD
jgi:hypothetical protein